MPIQVIDRNYSTRNHSTGNAWLLANAGQIVTDKLTVTIDYDFTSSMSMQVQFLSDFTIRILGANISSFGWVIGSTLDLTGTIDTGSGTLTYSADTYTIADINGDEITFTTSLDPPASGYIVGALMPQNAGANVNTPMLFESSIVDSETIEVYHNQVENSTSGSIYSLFDGEVNRFEAVGVLGLAVSGTINMVQLGKKSGGSYISAVLERIADVGGKKTYTVTFVYANPYQFFDADFDEPSCYNASKSLKPYYQIKAYPLTNNPNNSLSLTVANVLGNQGWLNESYNQGDNDFTIDSVVLTTSTGTPLDAIDYAQTTKVVATIVGDANFTDFAEIQFNLIPEISTVKNKLERQCDIISLSNCYFDVSTPTDIKQEFGAEIVIDNVSITVGTNETIIEFDLVPSVDFTAYLEAMTSDNRRCRLVATVESVGGDENDNNSVTLTLFEGLMEQAPIEGGIYPNTTFTGFFNHSQGVDGVSDAIYNGCTEDDFLFLSTFDLEKEKAWQRLELAVQVVNDSTGQSFDLLNRNIPFSPYTTDVDGVIHINYLEQIGQALDSTDRNKLSVANTGNEVGFFYEVQILWSLMASWRYWIAQNNALLEFFDTALPNNGKNNEWMRYLREAGYSIKVRCVLIDELDTAYYWNTNVNLQDYEDSSVIDSIIQYYDADDVEQSSLIEGQTMRVVATHTLLAGTWDEGNVWGWIGFRPFEAESMRRISTVWDWTTQNLPLRPLSAETKAKLTFVSPTVATVEARIDTTLLNVSNYTVVSRIETPTVSECESPILYLFNAVVNTAANEGEYLAVMTSLLDKGIGNSSMNICCPTCKMASEVDGLEYQLWAFGSKASIKSLLSNFVTKECCRDEYDRLSGCEDGFDIKFDFLSDYMTGDISALKTKYPSQINFYSSANMTVLNDAIIALTTDEALRYQIFDLIITVGIKAWCREDGMKRIEAIL